MERVKNLDRYQKGILVLLAGMFVVFTFAYWLVSSRIGYLYRDSILIPSEENGVRFYRGEIEGEDAEFSVTDDHIISFRHGQMQYGPYTLAEDPSSIPEEHKTDTMIGIEIREADEVMFRGGLLFTTPEKKDFYLYDENGWYPDIALIVTVSSSDGTVMDSRGNIIDPVEPTIYTVIDLAYGPELTSKGEWSAWFLGVVFSIFVILSILFREEIFRFGMAFRIRNVEDAEPSEWYTLNMYAGWGIMTFGVLALYYIGLR